MGDPLWPAVKEAAVDLRATLAKVIERGEINFVELITEWGEVEQGFWTFQEAMEKYLIDEREGGSN